MSLDINNQIPFSYLITPQMMLLRIDPYRGLDKSLLINLAILKALEQKNASPTTLNFMSGLENQGISTGINMAAGYLTSTLNFGDSEGGQLANQITSTATSTIGDTIGKNLKTDSNLFQGAGNNLKNAGLGLAIDYGTSKLGELGNKWMGDTRMSRFINTAGALAASLGLRLLAGLGGGFGPGAIAGIAGAGLLAAFGPSKEYAGKYGSITRTADTVYDVVLTGASFFGPVGQAVSGIMSLNKGLSNVFGSTDGMTKTDAILGSAWSGFAAKWLNMAGAKTTDTFGRLSWLNTEKANKFMGSSFGNLANVFSKAREEAGKTYGTFSRGAYNRALANVEKANQAWEKVLDMADLNEYQTIRSQDMSSINNLRYALNIQGGWSPLLRGKLGMKILNNATDHNRGMRYLSAAAFIDDKQTILSNWNLVCSVVY